MPGRPKKTVQQLALEKLVASLGDPTGKRVLEMGAGTGELSQQLAGAGAHVTILDLIEPEGLGDKNITFVQHDLSDGSLPFDQGTFDALVATEVIEHMKAPFLVLSSAVRVLRPGGILLLTMPNYWNLKYRFRYLLTGNVMMPANDAWKESYLSGYAPHINVLTYPTLRTVLRWEGCDSFEVDTPRRFNWRRRVGYSPLFLLVWLRRLFSGRAQSDAMALEETDSSRVLFGSRHVLLLCRRSESDARTTA
jgi:SAM-dependent methyltransferase